ncbi:MAG: hypothetical protein WAV85_12270 [Rhodoferax sp.]
MIENEEGAVFYRTSGLQAFFGLKRTRQAQRNSPAGGNAGLAMLLAQEPADAGRDAPGMQVCLDGLHEGWRDR